MSADAMLIAICVPVALAIAWALIGSINRHQQDQRQETASEAWLDLFKDDPAAAWKAFMDQESETKR